MEEKLLKELQLILDNDDLTVETKLKDEEDWDSIALLSISAFTKDSFGHALDSDDFNKVETITDIIKILNGK